MIELQGLITHVHKCISVLLQVSLNVHWSVSLYFFCVYICLYKKSLPFTAGPASTHGSTPADAAAASSSSSSSVSSPLVAGLCWV